jgi:ribosomal-protein-alanine N-acetyltransferase
LPGAEVFGWLRRNSDRAAARPLQGPHSEAVAAIHAASFAHGWPASEIARMLADSHILGQGMFVRERDLVAIALSRIVVDEAELLTIATRQDWRGRGAARDLLAAHLGALAARGVKTVFLEVEEGNKSARKLYAGYGFTEVGRREGYYRNPANGSAAALVMRLSLN